MPELVNYDYYSRTYKGTSIPANSFNKYAIDASGRVNSYTYGRITEDNISNDIRNATCEIADLIYSQEQLKARILSDTNIKVSETVGPHSVSYANKLSLLEKQLLSDEELDKKCYKICYKYIARTGLMYRGF